MPTRKPNTPWLVRGFLRRKRKGSNCTHLSFHTKRQAMEYVERERRRHYSLECVYAPIEGHVHTAKDGTRYVHYYHRDPTSWIPTLVSVHPA